MPGVKSFGYLIPTMNTRCVRAVFGALPAALLVCLAVTEPLFAQAESTPTSAVGFYRLMLRQGWNLISLPLVPDHPLVSEVFDEALTGGGRERSADRVLAWDPDLEEWIVAWKSTEVGWQGPLAADTVRLDVAYWVQIRDDHPDSQEVLLYGTVREDSTLDRGVFEPGEHLIGSIWAASLPLESAGLAEAGWRASSGLVPLISGDPQPDLLLAYDAERGWFRAAWLDGEAWRGEFDAFQTGAGYLLWLHDTLDWADYPRPDLAGGAGSAVAAGEGGRVVHHPIRRSAATIGEEETGEFPPMPRVRNPRSSPGGNGESRRVQGNPRGAR